MTLYASLLQNINNYVFAAALVLIRMKAKQNTEDIMKIYAVLSAILTLFMLMFPVVTLSIKTTDNQDTIKSTSVIEQNNDESENSETQNAQNANSESKGETIDVLRVNSGKVSSVSTRDYIIGAVASEISPLSEKEAIKAQAVACYTYAKYKMENKSDISDSSETCQGYADKSELKEKWGGNFDLYYKKIAACVDEVPGQYMTYKGKTIIAPYHAISPGKTENASVVWKEDISYLKSVSAPGDELCGEFDSTVTLSKDEFKKRAEKLGSVDLTGDYTKWVGKSKTSAVGYVKEITIGKKTFDASAVRSAFSLRSPYFTVSCKNGNIVFSVKGYGHGLGMSQYSADYMARQGSSYDEILKHFYKGIKIKSES